MVNCTSLEELDLSNTSVQRLGQWFLSGCTSVTTVKLPDSLTEISDQFMLTCTSLEELDLSNTSVQRLGHRFLSGCTSVTRVTLPDSCEELPAAVAGRCTKRRAE